MKKKYGPFCPYCGKKVNYFAAVFNKEQGEYTCKSCGKYSNVFYTGAIYASLTIFCILSIVLGLVIFKRSVLGIVLSAMSFILFYMTVPLFLKLIPIKTKPKNNGVYENISSGRKDISSVSGRPIGDQNDSDVKTYTPNHRQRTN